MPEKGNDEQLDEIADAGAVSDGVRADDAQRGEEEFRTEQEAEATDEPGEAYPDPDEGPAGDYDRD